MTQRAVQTEGHAPQAIVCADPFHLVKLVDDALDEVRRELWQQLRRLPDDRWAKDFKGTRWALLKNREDLTNRQAAQLARSKRNRGGIWRAYEMKEQFRVILTGDLTRDQTGVLLDRWCDRAQRSRLAPFLKVARTIRQRRELILNAVEHGISNGRAEGLILFTWGIGVFDVADGPIPPRRRHVLWSPSSTRRTCRGERGSSARQPRATAALPALAAPPG